jgi:hypothetical protein
MPRPRVIGIYTSFWTLFFLRLCRPMCGSGYALPEALGFFPGLRPDCLAKVAFYLIPKRWGHSPEEKGRRSRKGIAASAHRAA